MATNANAIRAGKAFVEISADDKKFQTGLDRIVKRFHGIGTLLQNTGKKFALTGAAMLAPLGAAFLTAVKQGDAVQKAADRLGASAEGVSRLQYAADLADSSLQDVVASNVALTKSAIAASKGSREQAAAFEKLGIKAEDFLKLDVDERFITIAQALEGINDPLERSQLLTSLLSKGASKLLPLLTSGADALRKTFEEAEKTGSVISGKDAQRAVALSDAMTKAWKEVKNTIIEVGFAVFGFTENLTEANNSFSNTLANIRVWVRENRVLITILAKVGIALLATGAALIVLGTGITAVSVAYAVLKTVALTTYAVLTAPIVGLIAAIATLVLMVGAATGKLKSMFAGIGDTFRSIGNTFGKMWNGILAALRKGDFQSLWKIVQYGMYAIFLDVVSLIRRKWNEFTNFFSDAFKDSVLFIRTLMLDLVRFIQTSLLDIILSIVKTANRAYAAIANLTGPVGGEPTPAAKQELEKLRVEQGAVRAKQLREIEKRDKLLADGAKETDEAIKALRHNIEYLRTEFERIGERAELVRKQGVDAANKLIDTAPFTQAIEDINKDIDKRVKGLKDADDKERAIRDKAQADRIKAIEAERDVFKQMIDEITNELNKAETNLLPVIGGAGKAIAGGMRGAGNPLVDKLGESVKGLFQSGDFRGALALGPASSLAAESVEVEKDILDELRGLRGDVRNGGLFWS